MARKKVEGSANISEVETEGLSEHKRGTDVGAGVKKILPGETASLESRNPKPYPNQKSVKKGFGDDINIQISSDDKARKKFEEEV